MFPSLHSPTLSAPFLWKALAALMGAMFLATPVTATATRARAEATAATAGPVAATAIETTGEPVAQRMIDLNANGSGSLIRSE